MEFYEAERVRLGVGLRVGVRIAVVWLVYVAGAALAPGMYGADVLGGVSLGALAAVVPLGVGLHGVVVYGRRVDRRIAAADEADDRRWA
ncbi:hypothetical protein ACH4NV_14780 [Streptomyces althioticus]|uniref:hypothetical protein n=1 Tax=Streptomyces althioticus group TaxID=2867194 RepID=UPI0017844CF3|nr:hypothetical protein OG968_07925 [Streptomyces althioticus]WTB95402.1 hypothetical protein OHA53_27855 [Streptomyces althioticus]GGQ56893.1 hypothetical protein GCM10010267_20090 [Streptomyces griseorubens]